MDWFDYVIPQFLFVENTKQYLNSNKGYLTSETFYKIGSNCGIFKQALENRYDEFDRTCDLKDVAMKLY